MKKSVIKTATVAMVAFGSTSISAETSHITFGSKVGEISIEEQAQIKASKDNKLDSLFVQKGPPQCQRICDTWEQVKEAFSDKDLDLAHDIVNLIS